MTEKKTTCENIIFNKPIFNDDMDTSEIEVIHYFCEDCEISYTGIEVTDCSFLCPNCGNEGIVE